MICVATTFMDTIHGWRNYEWGARSVRMKSSFDNWKPLSTVFTVILDFPFTAYDNPSLLQVSAKWQGLGPILSIAYIDGMGHHGVLKII